MNEKINLCEILKGLEGINLWCTVYGPVKLSRICLSQDGKHSLELQLLSNKNKTFIFVTEKGLLDRNYQGECVVFPSKDQRDWSKFERPIPIDTPMMCIQAGLKGNWMLLYYYKYKNDRHLVYDGDKSPNGDVKWYCEYTYMIPFDKFNPNDIEESLKYNINK